MERDGSDDIMNGKETLGNSLGRAPLGETRRSGDIMNGMKTVGNSLGRALLGGNEMEAGTSWKDRKPWGIAWGELRWKGARRKCGHCGRAGNHGK